MKEKKKQNTKSIRILNTITIIKKEEEGGEEEQEEQQ